MAASRSQRIFFAFAALAAVLVVGSAVYLGVGGTRLGAPFVFVLFAAVALAVSLFTLLRAAMSLLVEPEEGEVKVATGRRKKELEREKQALLKALKELEFDHEMRKISDGDYHQIAALYRTRAVRVMRQLDDVSLDYRQLAERDIAALRAARASRATVAGPVGNIAPLASSGSGEAPRPGKAARRSEAEAEALAATTTVPDRRGETLPDVPARVLPGRIGCPACRTENEPDATFCKSCATRMPVSEQAS